MPEKKNDESKWGVLASYGLALFTAVVLFFPPIDRLEALAPYVWPASLVVVAMLFRDAITRAIDRVVEISKTGVKLHNSEGFEKLGVASAKVEVEMSRGESVAAEPSPPSLSAPARKLLATLGFHQTEAFPDQERTHRWWMKIPRESQDYPGFEAAAKELLALAMIIVEPSGKTFLTHDGLEYYKGASNELSKVARFENFRPEE